MPKLTKKKDINFSTSYITQHHIPKYNSDRATEGTRSACGCGGQQERPRVSTSGAPVPCPSQSGAGLVSWLHRDLCTPAWLSPCPLQESPTPGTGKLMNSLMVESGTSSYFFPDSWLWRVWGRVCCIYYNFCIYLQYNLFPYLSLPSPSDTVQVEPSGREEEEIAAHIHTEAEAGQILLQETFVQRFLDVLKPNNLHFHFVVFRKKLK